MTRDLPERIAVTGAAGVLGRRLTARLQADGCQVLGIDLRSPEPRPGEHLAALPTVHHTADVRDARALGTALRDVDAVVHCAAALPSYPDAEIRSVIVDGTATVLAAARDCGLDRAVHISSTAVYGLPSVVPTTESHPREPVDTYSAAKAQAEEVADRHRDAGECVPVLRPKTFVGPGRLGLFAMLFEWADEGRRFPVLGRGDVRIQMLGLDDLADAVVAALVAPAEHANDTFNIGAAEFGTLREDFQAVLDAAGHGRQVVSIPARPAVAALRGLERLGYSPVYQRLLSKLLADSFVSIDKAAEGLGFVPTLSNREAVLRAYRWWRENRAVVGARTGGRTSQEPWRQGALRLAKAAF